MKYQLFIFHRSSQPKLRRSGVDVHFDVCEPARNSEAPDGNRRGPEVLPDKRRREAPVGYLAAGAAGAAEAAGPLRWSMELNSVCLTRDLGSTFAEWQTEQNTSILAPFWVSTSR